MNNIKKEKYLIFFVKKNNFDLSYKNLKIYNQKQKIFNYFKAIKLFVII